MLIFGVLPLYFIHKHYGLTNKHFANVIQRGLRLEAISKRKKLTFLGSHSSLRREIEVCYYYSKYLDSFLFCLKHRGYEYILRLFTTL